MRGILLIVVSVVLLAACQTAQEPTYDTHPVTLSFEGVTRPAFPMPNEPSGPAIAAGLAAVQGGDVVHRWASVTSIGGFGEPQEQVPAVLTEFLGKPGLFDPTTERALTLKVERMEFVNGMINMGLLRAAVVEVKGFSVLLSESGEEIHRIVVESEGDGSVVDQDGPGFIAGSAIREAAFNNIVAARQQLRRDADIINARIKSVS